MLRQGIYIRFKITQGVISFISGRLILSHPQQVYGIKITCNDGLHSYTSD